MDVRIAEDWKALLQEEFDKPYFAELVDFVKSEYASQQVFPAAACVPTQNLRSISPSVSKQKDRPMDGLFI